MITPYNFLRHELIGLKAEVVKATSDGYKISGTIIDETRNTLKIKTGNGEKTVPKDCVTIEFTLPGETIMRVDGKLLVSRPEERIKKKYRIKF